MSTRKITASKSSHDRDYIKFKDRISTLKYQHAVVQCGQKLLHLILRTLIRGDINKICDCVKEKLNSNTQFKNSFTTEEHRILEEGNHKKWDISLLFKVIQKVCGLEPAGDSCWTNLIEGSDSLEYLITTLKQQRNAMVHDFQLVLTKDQLEDRLTELTDLAVKVTSALGDRAPNLGKQLSDEESSGTMALVFAILDDVNSYAPPATHSPPVAVTESFDDEEDAYESDSIHSEGGVQFDSAYVAAGVGQSFQESWEEVIENLKRQIWECAGPEKVI